MQINTRKQIKLKQEEKHRSNSSLCTYKRHGKGPGIITKATLYSAALPGFQNTLLSIICFDLPNKPEREAKIIPIEQTRKLWLQDCKLNDLPRATHNSRHMLTQGLPLYQANLQVSLFVPAVTKWQLGLRSSAPGSQPGSLSISSHSSISYLRPRLFCSAQLTPTVRCNR